MKMAFLFLVKLCLCTLNLNGQKNATYKTDSDSLTHLIHSLESQYKLDISYLTEDVTQVYVSSPAASTDLEWLFAFILRDTELSARIDGYKIYLYRNQAKIRRERILCGVIIDKSLSMKKPI